MTKQEKAYPRAQSGVTVPHGRETQGKRDTRKEKSKSKAAERTEAAGKAISPQRTRRAQRTGGRADGESKTIQGEAGDSGALCKNPQHRKSEPFQKVA
jgi:hypothetical protein